MSKKIVKINGMPVVVGLEWEPLDSEVSERKAIRDIMSKNKGVKSGVLVRSADIAVLGLLPKEDKKTSAPSAAALVAYANQDVVNTATGQSSSIEDNQWIVVERLGEDQYWIVEVKDGVPLPGSDTVGSLERIRTYLSDDMMDGTSFKVFTTDEDVQNLVSASATIVPKSFADVVAGVKPSRAGLKTMSGVDPTIVIVIIAFLVIVGGYFAWDSYQTKRKAEIAQATAAANASQQAQKLKAEKAGYEQAVRQAILTALEKGVAQVNTALETPTPASVLESWVEMAETRPMTHSGWNMTRMECAMETPEKPACTVYLERGPYGINRVLLEDYPDVQFDGDGASYVLRGPDLGKRTADWKPLPNANALMIGLMSDLQFIKNSGISYSQAASKEIVQAISMPPAPPSIAKLAGAEEKAVAPPPVQLGVAQGQLGLSGTGLWQIRGLSRLLDRNGLAATTLQITFSGQDSGWRLENEYFLRSLPAPVLPVIVGADGPITAQLPAKYQAPAGSEPVQGGVQASSGTAPLPSAPGENDKPPGEDNTPLALGLPDDQAAPAPVPVPVEQPALPPSP